MAVRDDVAAFRLEVWRLGLPAQVPGAQRHTLRCRAVCDVSPHGHDHRTFDRGPDSSLPASQAMSVATEPVGGTPTEMAARMKAEMAVWARVRP